MFADGYFITGTDTDVGKTLVTTALGLRLQQQGQLQMAAMKPVASGCDMTTDGLRNADALLLQQHLCPQLDYDAINPYRFAPAISPHLAAAEAGQTINLTSLKATWDSLAANHDCVLVEGVGGWLAPIDSDGTTMADLAKQLELPVIMVVAIKLGCLNHALLTVEAIKHSGLSLAGWVANLCQPDTLRPKELISTLQNMIDAPHLGTIPMLEKPASTASLQQAASHINILKLE